MEEQGTETVEAGWVPMEEMRRLLTFRSRMVIAEAHDFTIRMVG